MPKVSPTLQRYIDDGLFDRLPRTFAAYTFDQLKAWDGLFPAEQAYFERLFGLLARSDEQAVKDLFAPLAAVEERMGVDRSTWSTKEFTLEHVDFLQRNRRLPEWRQAIADIFARIDPLLDAEVARQGRSRLVIVLTPPELPMGPDRMWLRLKDKGKLVRLEVGGDDPLTDYLPKLLTGAPRAAQRPAIHDLYGERAENAFDAWVIEVGDPIHRLARSFEGWTGLSYGRLAELRTILMEQVNEMVTREQIPGPRQLGERLQRMNPGALKRAAGRDPVLRDFLQSVLLNGNGTLLVNNTFVEWATVQAIRRARPALVCASFGIRNKVKPFSSLLIYADQEEVNPIPTQADMLGSYVDLEIFHQYVWQECEKWPEYRLNTAYLFVGEGMDALLAIAPPDFPLLAADAPMRLEDVFREAKAWLGV
jgi:hypothetical protein